MSYIYVIANRDIVRILGKVKFIKYFEEYREKLIPDIIDNTANDIYFNSITTIDKALKLWDINLKRVYPLFWIINTDNMEANFKNYTQNIDTKIKLSLSIEELLNINYQDENNYENIDSIFAAKDKILELIKNKDSSS